MARPTARRVSLAEIMSTAKPTPRKTGKQRFLQVVGSLFGIVMVIVLMAGILAVPPLVALAASTVVAEPAVETWRELPEELENVAIAERSYLYTKDGEVFATLWAENRITLDSLDQVSPNTIDALIATEDKRFWEHGGFDPVGIARAAASRSGGGSGITQQLVKNLQFFDLNNQEGEKEAATEASLTRKLRELKLSINYEKTHSKEEILLEYLNTVAVGGPTVYGIETASQYFFGVSASDLSLAQSAALIGSINNPGYYGISDDIEGAWRERQLIVLERMVDEGYITQSEASEAKDEEITPIYKKLPGSCSDSAYPFYCDAVLDELRESPRLGDTPEQREAVLFRGGLHVKTFLDASATSNANAYLSSTLGNDNRIVAPVAVVQPSTGGVVVMAQNRGYGEGPGNTYINLPETPAGTGSVFKLVTLAAAGEAGIDLDSLKITPRCPLVDSRIDLPAGGIKNAGYCPTPHATGLLEATATSSNVWFIELALRVGIDNVIAMSNKLGLSNTDGMTSRSGSFPLGVTEESPVNVAAAYATFVNEGIFCPAKTVNAITYEDGTPIPVADGFDPSVGACQRVISPHTASTVLRAAKAVVDGSFGGAATGTKFAIPGFDTVGKTGTNNLMNTTWTQLSSQYSVFVNTYNMDTPLDGIEFIWFKGEWWKWTDHAPGRIGSDILGSMLAGQENKPLNYSATDREVTLIPVETRDFTTVPSVVGMTPSEAVSTLELLGFVVKVDKELVAVEEADFPTGVIASQSIAGGERVPTGSSREIILAVSE